MSTPIRFAIIGLDHWYTAISLAEEMASHPDIELVGIAHDDKDRAQEVAAKAGNPTVSTDPATFLNDPSIDAIGSFVSVDRNPDIVIAAARASKHILSIKPLARTLDEATQIVRAVREADVAFIPAETRARENDQNQHLLSLVRGGKLGRIVSGNFTLSSGLPKGWPDAAADGGWWADPERAPGGGWIDHSIYQIDLLRWLLGERVVAVSGRTANLVHRDLGVEDYGHATIEFEGGAIFSVEDTWSGPAGGWHVTSSLVGSEGAVSIDSATGTIATFGVETGTQGWSHAPLAEDTSDRIGPIVSRIRGEQTALGTVEDAWENLAVTTAFYEAAANGSVVSPRKLTDEVE
ncbi:MAG TPA: Gfo/Idh/MocA family oxidoreductase [Thermomicrobiales bacterium]|nr:Gfo/Idh/MocA family oxidoreductase [Thermomicrobiales bacterium]